MTRQRWPRWFPTPAQGGPGTHRHRPPRPAQPSTASTTSTSRSTTNDGTAMTTQNTTTDEPETEPGSRPEAALRAVTLPDGALPCADCGQIVHKPDPTTVLKVERVKSGRATYVAAARCADCSERDRAASDLAAAHLRGGVIVGERQYGWKDAARLISQSRAAFAAAGAVPLAVEGHPSPAAALAVELTNLGHEILGLRWRDRLSPPRSLVAEPVHLVEPGTANARPWAHLEEPERDSLRQRVATVLVERRALLEPPALLAPPPLQASRSVLSLADLDVPDGCLYCGVGTVALSALTVSRAGGCRRCSACGVAVPSGSVHRRRSHSRQSGSAGVALSTLRGRRDSARLGEPDGCP